MMDILGEKVSFFETIFSDENKHVKLGQILSDIQCGRWEEDVLKVQRKELLKKYLPSVYFSGTFSGSHIKTLQRYNGVLVLDFDKVPRNLDEFRKALMADPHIITAFTSPSGNGMKALIHMNTTPEEHKNYGFTYAQYYFKEEYGLDIDAQTKNINRHCFVSFDMDMTINGDMKTLEIPVFWTGPSKSYSGRSYPNRPVSNDVTYIFDTLVKWQNLKGGFTKGNRNNHVFGLICDANRYGITRDTCRFSFCLYSHVC